MILRDLQEKYGLPESQVIDAVETATTHVLSRSFRTDMMVKLQDSLEIFSLHPSFLPPRSIDPATLPGQLQRQIRFQIGRELEKRQVLHERETLSVLQGRAIMGEIRQISSTEAKAALEIEDHFRRLALIGVCPVRFIPPNERKVLAVGDMKTFLVTSVLPVREKGRAKVLIRLSRTSKSLPEVLLRERTGEMSIRCVRRIAGAFSVIEAARKLLKDDILAVGLELKERIIVRIAEEKRT